MTASDRFHSQFGGSSADGCRAARPELHVVQLGEPMSVLNQESAIGYGQRLVETVDRIVSGRAERPAPGLAEKRECTVFDYDHFSFAGQGQEIVERLRPSGKMDQVQN